MGKIVGILIGFAVVALFFIGIGFVAGATMIEPENSCVDDQVTPSATISPVVTP